MLPGHSQSGTRMFENNGGAVTETNEPGYFESHLQLLNFTDHL